MSIPYETTGRTRQKERTRATLVAAARDLLSRGISPTVEQAADAAQVARATAYRYFPNQRGLLAATYPEIQKPSLLVEPAPHDPEERLELVVHSITRQIVEHEAELRANLRLSLEPVAGARDAQALRTGRRITWVADALSPLNGRLADADLRRLINAIAAAVGIEAFVWLTDRAGLTPAEAAETMRWSAAAMLRSLVVGAGRAGP
jgi:AcrR family transcriptional regulator